ncbi:aldose 1-epimerase [Malassezia psittaci]|uniref:Aldose 1-epimerase n=1 Tax=Malassezia psittaci TaxID=1821823 RepID=A0AAF0FFG3_9BASI|nr:aldose 1-epimerase [Malassezia psittaci]
MSDILAGPENPATHADQRRFCGSLVGRYANRLPAGTLSTKEFTVLAQEWGGKGVSHHGGPPQHVVDKQQPTKQGPLDTVHWSVETAPQFFDASNLQDLEDYVVMAFESKAGDQGYPGLIRIEALTGVRQKQVHVEYRARILDKCAATPLNLTQHWGFHLMGSKKWHSNDAVPSPELRISHPHRVLELDCNGIPTGNLLACNAHHDWTHGKAVQFPPQDTYDNFYIWGKTHENPVVQLQIPNEISVDFSTNQTGVQLYANDLSMDQQMKRKHAHRTVDDEKSSYFAVFLEFSAPHATFLHDTLQQAAGCDTVLRQGETCRNWVSLEINLPSSGNQIERN